MKATLIQTDIQWADAIANRTAMESALLRAEQSDIYILPEMWSTGFVTSPTEGDDGAEQWMQQMSQRLDAAVVGSVVIMDGGRYYNRMLFVTPDGTLAHYDKRHLFSYGGENEHYTAGTERVVVMWRGVRFLLQICYDLRFPVFSRNHRDYDAIIYVASWPVNRIQVWHTLLQARALENQCFVLAVNRIGNDPVCQYNGGTQALDAYGRIIGSCADNEADALTVTLDMERLAAFRKKFPVLYDADV